MSLTRERRSPAMCVDVEDRSLVQDWTEWTIGSFLEERARRFKDRPCVEFEDEGFTYESLDEHVRRVATGLRDWGILPGDRVAVMLHNGPDLVLIWLALARLGAVMVPLNTGLKGELLEQMIRQVGISASIVNPETELPLRRAANCSELGHKPILTTGTKEYEQVRAAEPTNHSDQSRNNDLTAVFFTSGTSGPSKGVMLCHTHMFVKALSTVNMMRMQKEDVLFSTLPLFHSLACTRGVLAPMIVGASSVFRRSFSASGFWKDIRDSNATLAHSVFAMTPILLAQPKSPADRQHNVRAMYTARQDPVFEERFGVKLIEPYGSTETDAVTYMPYDAQRPNSCGKESPFYEVSIVDDNDNPVPPGVAGEIVVRPRIPWILTLGYFDQPQATADAFRNLWFHTGDNGRRDEEGYFYFADKKKDSIRRRGENISSWEVESIINMHPSIVESAAIAVPSELDEEEVMVCIVADSGDDVDAEDVWRWCEERMPKHMVPRYIEFLQSLPRTENDRIQKFQLRNRGVCGVTKHTLDRLQVTRSRNKRESHTL